MDMNQSLVMEFHDKFGSTVGRWPELRDTQLAAKLILEEAVETCAAMGFDVTAVINVREPGDPTSQTSKDTLEPIVTFHKNFERPDFNEVIDGLADTLYVVYGAAIRFGIDLQPFFEEVHRSNMTKEGGTTRGDGKILKPEGWQPPDIDRELIRQQTAADMWIELEQAALDDNFSPVEVINAAESAA